MKQSPSESKSEEKKDSSFTALGNESNGKKDFPFTAEHFLEAVDEAAKRSRRLLLILLFTSIIILMALINSIIPEYNWFSSKSILFKNIIQYIELPNSKKEKGEKVDVVSFDYFMFYNESINNNHILTNSGISKKERDEICEIDEKYSRYNIMLKSPKIAPIFETEFKDRLDKYRQLGMAIEYVEKHQVLNEGVLQNYIDKMDAAEIEHIDLVRVPILGVSFHINYLSFYSGLTLIVLYFLFYFSLKREHINSEIAFRRGWRNLKDFHHHYYFYEYLSMFQVLSIPRKLFEPPKENWLHKVFSFISILLPFFVYVGVVMYDFFSRDIGMEANPILTKISIYLSCFFGVIICIISVRAYLFWLEMDKLWNYQALEFNFECILEKLEIDKIHDFTDLTTCTLTKDDEDKVKSFWYETINNFLVRHQSISPNRCYKMYSNFINVLLTKDALQNYQPKSHENLDKCWNELHQWYVNYGKRGISKFFDIEFLKMVYRIQNIINNKE